MAFVAAGRLKRSGTGRKARKARVLDSMSSLSDAVPEFQFNCWIGVVAPCGMPAITVGKFRDALAAAMRVPALAATLTANGAFAHPTTPTEFRALLVRDIEATRRTMRSACIEPE